MEPFNCIVVECFNYILLRCTQEFRLLPAAQLARELQHAPSVAEALLMQGRVEAWLGRWRGAYSREQLGWMFPLLYRNTFYVQKIRRQP